MEEVKLGSPGGGQVDAGVWVWVTSGDGGEASGGECVQGEDDTFQASSPEGRHTDIRGGLSICDSGEQQGANAVPKPGRRRIEKL